MNKTFTLGSLFSGIGGFDLGFERAGMKTAWQVEIDPFCNKVLAARFPHAERFTDVIECGAHKLQRVDVICGGSPCQGFSVAGRRGGLNDQRSGLFREYARILSELRPTWFVFENVPGLLSQNGGRDFGEVLRIFMVECGYGVSWRVLNSQFFGVAQRRRRLFVAGYLGRPCPPEILFEPTRGDRNPAAGKETRADIAAPLTRGSGVTGNDPGRRREDDVNLVRVHPALTVPDSKGVREDIADPGFVVASTLTSRYTKNGHGAAGPRVEDIPNFVCGPLGGAARSGGFSPNCEQAADGQLIAAPITASYGKQVDSSDRNGGPPNLIRSQADASGVRDFAGLPEGMDSARYRALGNAVTVNVAEWIGKRIVAFELNQKQQEKAYESQ